MNTLEARVGVLILVATSVLAATGEAQGAPLEIARLHPGGPSLDLFGSAVLISDSTIVVGAPRDGDFGPTAGAVYVYQESQEEPGQWFLEQKIEPPEAISGSDREFGTSLGMTGSTLAVGWPQRSGTDGAVAIFERNGPSQQRWQHVKTITAETNDRFGSSIALEGEILAVTALTGCGCVRCFPSGSVRVFGRNTGGPDNWGQLARIPSPGGSFDRFGYQVVLHDGEVLASAPNNAAGVNFCPTGPGALHVLGNTGPGAWGVVQSVGGPSGYAHVFAASDSLIAVLDASTSARQVHVFEKTSPAPAPWQLLKTIDGNFAFGAALLVHKNKLFVTQGPFSNPGCVELYARNAGGSNAYGFVATIKPSDSFSGDVFGGALAMDGRRLVVGAPGEFSSSVYVFEFTRGPRVRLGHALPNSSRPEPTIR